MRTREKINQFLTEAMGECWHDIKFCVPNWYCNKCLEFVASKNNDFFDWNGFGKLWEWVKNQDCFDLFQCELYYHDYLNHIGYVSGDEHEDNDQMMSNDYINPEIFALKVYEFLNREEND